MNRVRLPFAAGMLVLLILAAAFRLPRLEQRPMHADEANQAVKAGRLYEKGDYKYDTTDHHGPSLYWLTLPSLWLSGASDLAHSREGAYRIVPVIFGIGLVPLLLLFVDGLGWPAVVGAALLTAISPAMVFYSRYYIQETLLVFFTLAALGCGWRYVRTRRIGWILAVGAAVGMMHATKETWVLAAAAAGGTAVLEWGCSKSFGIKCLPQNKPSPPAPLPSTGEGSFQHVLAVWFGTNFRLLLHILAAWICANARLLLHLLAAVIVGCLVAGAFFSMFGKHLRGPLESIAAYANYFHRSQQDEHAEPWYYYLQLLFFYWPAKRIFWSEGLIAGLAIIGGVSSFVAPRAAAEAPRSAGVSSDPRLLRFLTFYTLLLTLFYSIIRYKTPWCAMSFLMGMMLLAGAGTTAILRYLPGWPLKTLAAVALVVGAGQLGWQAYESNFDPRWISDPRNPYVYAHTPAPLPRLADRFDRLAQHVPNGHDLRVQVVVPENYWPLPWYLRHFDEKHAGYWLDVNAWLRDRDHLPQPAIVIVAAEVDGEDIAARLAGYDGHVHESLRPGVPITVYIRKDLWEAFLDCR